VVGKQLIRRRRSGLVPANIIKLERQPERARARARARRREIQRERERAGAGKRSKGGREKGRERAGQGGTVSPC